MHVFSFLLVHVGWLNLSIVIIKQKKLKFDQISDHIRLKKTYNFQLNLFNHEMNWLNLLFPIHPMIFRTCLQNVTCWAETYGEPFAFVVLFNLCFYQEEKK